MTILGTYLYFPFISPDLFDIKSIDINSAQIFAVRPLVGLYGNYTLNILAEDRGVPLTKFWPPTPFVWRTTMTIPPDLCHLMQMSPLESLRWAKSFSLSFLFVEFNYLSGNMLSVLGNILCIILLHLRKIFIFVQNATVGSLVIQVRAVDDDIGANGAVLYRLKRDLLGTHKTFGVDEMTGAITLLQPLDREKQKIYEVREIMWMPCILYYLIRNCQFSKYYSST